MEQTHQNMTTGAVIKLGLLVLLAFLGNFYALPLFYGADFVFGSAAVLLIIYFFGPIWGVAAAVVINSYTYFLWGHPYGFIIFTLEALCVGLIFKKRRRNLVLVDGLFWLCVGIPMNALFYFLLLHMDATTGTFIILKQGINGTFNALLASLAINHPPLYRFLGGARARKSVSLQETAFVILAAIVLIPALLLTVVQIRGERRQTENFIVSDLKQLTTNIQTHLASWYRQSLYPVNQLALAAGDRTIIPLENLQQKTEILQRSFPDFHSLHVEDASGTTVACYPAVGEKGSTIGVNLAGREWFQAVKAGHSTYLSDVFVGQKMTPSPVITLSVPVLNGGRFLGAATASLDLQRIKGFLGPYGKEREVRITLTDSQGRVIASNVPERVPMQVWDWKKNGVVSQISPGTYRWLPDSTKMPSMTRWKKSYFVQVVRIDSTIPWTLVLEAPLAPYQKHLYAIYVLNLTIMSVLVLLTLFLAFALSRWLAKPLTTLAMVTSGLPDRISSRKAIEWPTSQVQEIHSLIANYQSMTQALKGNFQDMEDHSNALATTNRELKVEIDERKQAETALRNSEAKYRSLIDNASEGILLFDLSGKIREANQEMQNMYGHSRGELAHLHLSALHASAELDRVNAAFQECMRTGKVSLLDCWLQCSDDTKVPVDITASRIEFAGETVIQWIYKDISDRQKSDAERLKISKLESLGVLAGGIAHDFNNILTVILGNITLARLQLQEPGEVLHRLKDSENAAVRAKDLTQQLLTFARGGAPVKKVIRIESLIKEAAGFAIHGSAVKCEFVFAENIRALEADEGQLSQVIHNLVLNAVQAMPEGGTLTIAAHNASDPVDGKRCVVISVRDAGAGIPQDLLQKIFDPYFTTKRQGSGLGLATCYSIIKRHGGTISVESTPGQGTTFQVQLPASAQVEEAACPDCFEVARGKGRILVMDDDKMVLEIARASLEELGYLVECTENGSAAIELYRCRMEQGIPFLAVIMDLTIPGEIGGKDAITAILQFDPDVKAVVSSGYSTDPVMANYREYGFSAVLKKPFRLKELSEMFQELFKG